MNIIKPTWFRGLEYRAQNIEERDHGKVVAFEPTRVREIREQLRVLEIESDRNVGEQIALELELKRLGYSRE
jgi:hypothetical protein